MNRVLPILFNTDMVRAILEGRKSVTRRLMKIQPWDNGDGCKHEIISHHDMLPQFYKGDFSFVCRKCGLGIGWDGKSCFNPQYKPGDILYVRETWQYIDFTGDDNGYVYKASDYGKLWETETEDWKWRPSIHMPKEAARIWLKVKNVRVERLQDITEEQAYIEGTNPWDEACYENNGWHPTLCDPDSGGEPNIIDGFHKLWNSTIKKSDHDCYGWDANPWVFVYEFDRCEKPKQR